VSSGTIDGVDETRAHRGRDSRRRYDAACPLRDEHLKNRLRFGNCVHQAVLVFDGRVFRVFGAAVKADPRSLALAAGATSPIAR